MFCDYCGNTSEGQERIHSECLRVHKPRLADARREFLVVRGQNAHVLCMAIHATYLYGQGKTNQTNKQKRAIKIKELLNYASALRNSDSGFILIHIVGLASGDRFTGAFDEFADVKLHGLINDGSSFDEVYKKQWLGDVDVPELKPFTDILVLTVNGGDLLVISDIKTKSSLDDCIIDTPGQTFYRIVKKAKQFEWKKENTPSYSLEDLTHLHEKRDIQAKACFQHNNGSDRLVQLVVEKLRLTEYITAFSKLETGGSYFLGLAEETHVSQTGDYCTKKLVLHPATVENPSEIEQDLKECVYDTVLICDYVGKNTDIDDLIQIFFIPTTNPPPSNNKDYVVHVYVRPVNGVVFLDNIGPEVYNVDEESGSINCLSMEEIFHCIKQLF